MAAVVSALSDYPEFVPVVARWHWREWGTLIQPGPCAHGRQAGADQMPGTLVAVAQGAPVGAVCLVEHDMPGHEAVPGMSPWINGLYVAQPARRHGHGALLVSRCETWAAALGHHALYLYTERGSAAEQPYKRLGWRIIRYERYDGMDVTVMRKNLSPVPPAGPAKITLACKRRQKGVLICRIDGRQAC